MPTRRTLIQSAAATVLAAPGLAGLARAQAWPAKPITFVVPFPAGGGTDLVVRAMQAKLQAELGVPVVVDNRSGAGGTVGTGTAARAAPDGYTLVVTTTSTVAAALAVYPKLGYDPVKDLKHITFLGVSPYILAVPAGLDVKNLREFIAYAKARKGQLNYASVGAGTLSHLIGELFKQRAGVDMAHVPYRGAAPALVDLMGGVVQALFDNPATLTQQIRAGKVKGLATTQKSALLSDLPTFAESGLGNFTPELWYGIAAPAHTPDSVVQRVHAAVAKVQEDRSLRADYLSKGVTPLSLPTSLMLQRIAYDTRMWGEVARSVGARAE